MTIFDLIQGSLMCMSKFATKEHGVNTCKTIPRANFFQWLKQQSIVIEYVVISISTFLVYYSAWITYLCMTSLSLSLYKIISRALNMYTKYQ